MVDVVDARFVLLGRACVRSPALPVAPAVYLRWETHNASNPSASP